MAISERTGLTTAPAQAPAQSRVGSSSTIEWTARSLRPVASWVLVPQGAGMARLEMVWQVPDPMASDAL